MKAVAKFLSQGDCLHILDLINALISCNSEDSFRALINRLSILIPFDFAICGMNKLLSDRISSFQIINISYPTDWLELYLAKRYYLIDPIVSEHYKNFKLQYWTETYRKYDQVKNFVSHARDFNLHDGYTTGVWESKNNLGSIFTLSCQHARKSFRTEFILNTLMPHFHQVLLRLIGHLDNKSTQLTPREKEVLNWLKFGKSSWDVSRILNISERTVNFHCSSIVQKLDATNRSHALAIAIDKGIVTLD